MRFSVTTLINFMMAVNHCLQVIISIAVYSKIFSISQAFNGSFTLLALTKVALWEECQFFMPDCHEAYLLTPRSSHS